MKTTDQQTGRMPEAGGSSGHAHLLPPLKKQDFDRAGKLFTNVSMAMEALWANRLRSLLTMLGIFIGVAGVIGAATMTQGVGANISNSIASLGANMIILSPGTSNSASGATGGRGNVTSSLPSVGTTQSLSPADVQAITTGPTKISDVISVSPVIAQSGTQVIAGNQTWNTTVQGVDISYLSIRSLSVEEGSWLSDIDQQAGKSVAVLGQTVYQQLFADIGKDPLNQSILINHTSYHVIGVLAAQGGASNADNAVYVPSTTALARLKNTGYVDQILVQVDTSDNIPAVQQAITRLLEKQHHITGGMPDDFTITTSTQLLQTFNQQFAQFTALLVGIAAISLTVGGIGIMNIMIVSVTERTREIGIRLSIGAQRQDIRNQFLIEALVLSLAGGAIGLLLGLLLGYGITRAFVVPYVINPISLLLAFGVSASVGVIFGFYPAARAAQLDPIDALRTL